MIIHILCCSWGLLSWNTLPASISRGSPELCSCIQMPVATVLGKTILSEQSNHFSILKRKAALAVLQRFWGGEKWLAVGGMGLKSQHPCRPCPGGPTQGPHESALLSSKVWVDPAHQSHQCNGSTLVWGTARGPKLWPWRRGPAAELCLPAHSPGLQDKSDMSTMISCHTGHA